MNAGFEWFVAWRYLRERGRRASWLPMAIGGLFIVGAAVAFYLSANMRALPPVDVAAGMTDWRYWCRISGLVSLVLGVLVGVFGYLHTLQSIFTTISTYGVFLGTAALVIVLSVMNGFEADLRVKILGSNAHVLVTRELEGPFTEWREVEQKIQGVPGIVAYTPYLTSEVVVAANSNYAGAIIKGIDPRTVGSVTDLVRNLEGGAHLERLWPILPDGGAGEYARGADAGPAARDAGTGAEPADFSRDAGADEEPPDFSGGAGAEPADASGSAGGVADQDVDARRAGETAAPAPTRRSPVVVDDEEPIDFSGAEAAADASVAVTARDARTGARDAGPAGLLRLAPDAAADDDLGPPPPRPRRNPAIDQLDGILVGRELAKTLHLYVDQEVQVISPLGQDTPTGQIPRVRRFRVAGKFFSGMYEYDTKFVYVTLPAFQRFLSLGDEVTGIEIKVADSDETHPIVAALKSRLGPAYRVQDWKEINRSLFSALRLEKIAMFLVLTIIILVASLSIISNLIMVVVEKAREIAILKSLGASNQGVMRVFMIEGLYIGLLGTAFGIAVGLATCWALGRFGFPLDANVYYIDRLPVATEPASVLMVAFAGVAISFIATIYPSYVAARLRPVDGLRWQ